MNLLYLMSYIYVCVNWAIQMLLNFCTLNSIVNSIIWKIPTMGLNLFPPLHMQTPLDKKEKEHKFYALRWWWWLHGLWAGFMNQKEIIFHHARQIERKKKKKKGNCTFWCVVRRIIMIPKTKKAGAMSENHICIESKSDREGTYNMLFAILTCVWKHPLL